MSHRIAFLGSERSYYWSDLLRVVKEPNTIVQVGYEELSCFSRQAGSTLGVLEDLGAILVRSMPLGSLEQVVFRMNLLAEAEAAGMLVVNPPRAMEIAIDKFLATRRLLAAGLSTPATHVSQTWLVAMQAFHELGGDVVVKPIFGGEGRGLTRISDEELAIRAFKMLEQMGAVIYQQRFIDHTGSDMRLLVLGQRIWGIRRTNAQDWRTNVSRGATTSPLEVTDELAEMAFKATRAVGAVFAGIDVLEDRDGRPYVLEVNAVPGWKALAQTLDVDIAAELLNHLVASIARSGQT